MRIGISPSPSPPPQGPSSPRISPRRLRKSNTPHKPTPPASNRYGLRDSDTSETSEDEDSLYTEDESPRKDMTPQQKTPTSRRSFLALEDDSDWDEKANLISMSPNLATKSRTKEEQWEQEEFYAAVKLRQRRDPVQEYEDRTRREAWHLAHVKNREQWLPITSLLETTPDRTSQQLADLNARQVEEVRRVFEEVSISRSREQDRRRQERERQDLELKESIERSIAAFEEEERLANEEREKAALAAKKEKEEILRKQQLEAEAKAREAVLKQKEQAAKAAEEKKRLEQEEQRRKEEEERVKREEEESKLEAAGSSFRPASASKELKDCRDLLRFIKSDVMPQVKTTKGYPQVKPHPEWKKELTRLRRQIVPKVGQVTNVQAEVERITTQLHGILAPPTLHPEPLYNALLYVLSKAFLKQAEEEVTAKPSTAFPLARILVGLVERGHFKLADIFMAKLVSMSSHWIIGTVIAREPGQSDEDYHKALGHRSAASGESTVQYIDRICGLVTLYAAILQAPNQSSPQVLQQISPFFRLSRFWTWMTRLIANRDLMSDRAAPNVLAAALETAGDRGIEVWGRQMDKLRTVIGKKAFEEDGAGALGGVDGKAGRVRLGLLLESWQNQGTIRPAGREFDS